MMNCTIMDALKNQWDKVISDKVVNYIIEQAGKDACGTAALAAILHFWNIDYDIQNLKLIAKDGDTGEGERGSTILTMASAIQTVPSIDIQLFFSNQLDQSEADDLKKIYENGCSQRIMDFSIDDIISQIEYYKIAILGYLDCTNQPHWNVLLGSNDSKIYMGLPDTRNIFFEYKHELLQRMSGKEEFLMAILLTNKQPKA